MPTVWKLPGGFEGLIDSFVNADRLVCYSLFDNGHEMVKDAKAVKLAGMTYLNTFYRLCLKDLA